MSGRSNRLWKWVIGIIGIAVVAAFLYWPHWSGTAGASAIENPRNAPFLRPDPALFDAFLETVVSTEGFVDYQRARAPEVRQYLDNYLDQVARATPAQFESQEQRLAFYINAYNAATIAGVLHYWPIESVKDVGYASQFFREKRYQIAGQSVSLHGFETKVIAQYNPLYHFGLNCASYSCPPLRRQAYRAEQLEKQLQAQAYRYLTNPRYNHFDYDTRTWYLAKIFEWYSPHFGGEAGVLQFVQQQLPAISPPQKVRYIPYDWQLNDKSNQQRS